MWTMTRCSPSERPNLHVKWLKRALLDLDDAEAYMAHADPLAAAEVVLKIIRAVSLLKDQPGLGRAGRVPGTKSLLFPIPIISFPIGSKTTLSKSCESITHHAFGLAGCNPFRQTHPLTARQSLKNPRHSPLQAGINFLMEWRP